MNGYLQRLIRIAANPAESVHPLAASPFAAGYHGDLPFAESAEVPVVQPSEETSPDSAQGRPILASTHASLSGLEPNSTVSEPQARQSIVVTPAEPQSSRVPMFSREIVSKPPRAYDALALSDAAEDAESAMADVSGSQRNLSPRLRGPLLSAETVTEAGKPGVRPPLERLRPASDKKDSRPVPASATASLSPDEIQIHIGRIEVTAVHSPAPAAAKARDKEISLDAYLKRRDGRAG